CCCTRWDASRKRRRSRRAPGRSAATARATEPTRRVRVSSRGARRTAPCVRGRIRLSSELAPDEIRAHQLLPTREQQEARAEFTLAWHLHRAGRHDAAERHFRRAGELAPRDWTIRRGSLPIRGIDPMASEEFLALWQEGAARYPAPPLPGAAASHGRIW